LEERNTNMPIPVAVPIVAGVVAVGAIGLRLMALAKAKTSVAAPPPPPAASNLPKAPPPPTPPPATPIVPAPTDPRSVEQILALPKLVSNPDGSPRQEGTPFIFNSTSDAQSAVDEANRRGISVAQVLLERSGQLAKGNSGDGVAALGQRAVVTTNDPAPSGDLIIRSAASTSAPQIGGAEKNGTVTILDSSDPVFARIQWGGGSRLPAATGFSKKQFLKLI
jgi:hypothetical protein